jgi:hypothetical protein
MAMQGELGTRGSAPVSAKPTPASGEIILYGDTWIEKLRNAYMKLAQWRGSKIKYLLDDCVLLDNEMIEYFQQINSNSDGQISWAELASYIMVHSRSKIGNNIDRKVRIEYLGPDPRVKRVATRASGCKRIRSIHRLDQILSL